MPTLTEEDVYTFEQLSDEAKDKARSDRREQESGDFDTEFLFQDFHTAAKILGIEIDNAERRPGKLHEAHYLYSPDIRYSGFSSQGDGASFIGSYSHAPGSPAKIRAEFPEETALQEIADGLEALQIGYRLLTGHRIGAAIFQSGNYYHEMTMSVTAVDAETGDDCDDPEHEVRLTALMRDFARYMYKSLEAEYDYRQSDEAIDEILSECEFDEDGERID